MTYVSVLEALKVQEDKSIRRLVKVTSAGSGNLISVKLNSQPIGQSPESQQYAKPFFVYQYL